MDWNREMLPHILLAWSCTLKTCSYEELKLLIELHIPITTRIQKY